MSFLRPFLAGLLALAALATAAAQETAAAPARPNIILILSDDHTYSHYGFMGHPIVQTPHLDRMAGESLLYTRGYTMPVCSPSLASLLTGQYPRRHGITGNDLAPPRKGERDALREHLLTHNPLILPRALGEAGYLTFQTGKLWNASYHDMGFTHGMTAKRDRHGGAGLTIGRKGMEPIFEFIRHATAEEKPFFIWHAPFLPHDPHNPPAELLAKYAGRGPTPHAEVYHAMVEWLDRTCGELDTWLENNHLKQNTVILYLSDNGWDPLHGYQGGRAKMTPYENGIRSPIFLRWPGKIPAARDEETLASIVDAVPTLLSLAGIPLPEDLPGLNLADTAAMRKRKHIFVESYTHDIARLGHPQESLMARVVIEGWTKLILPGPARCTRPFARIAGETELYDLRLDPQETRNLASQRPEEVTRLRTLLEREWAEP
jgi:arylsulfatase A-like enzyme